MRDIFEFFTPLSFNIFAFNFRLQFPYQISFLIFVRVMVELALSFPARLGCLFISMLYVKVMISCTLLQISFWVSFTEASVGIPKKLGFLLFWIFRFFWTLCCFGCCDLVSWSLIVVVVLIAVVPCSDSHESSFIRYRLSSWVLSR